MKDLTQVFWLVTYRPFMQTHPCFLHQVFLQCNIKHFSVTAWGGKKRYGCLLMCFWCRYKEPLVHALNSKKQKGSHSWLLSCQDHHHPPCPEQLVQAPHTTAQALLLKGLRKAPAPGHRWDQSQASSCAKPDKNFSTLSAFSISHKVKEKANVSIGIWFWIGF